MKLRIILCCETCILDARTNTVSCINLIEEMNSPQFPFLIPQFSVFALFEKEGTDTVSQSCEIKICVGTQELARGPLEVGFESGWLHRTMVSFQGLIIPTVGQLEVSIESDGKLMGDWKMPVTQAQTEPNLE